AQLAGLMRLHGPSWLAELAAVPAAVRDGRDGLLEGVVARQPVGEASDPQRLGVPVPGAREGQDPVAGGELLSVPADDRQRACVHELEGGEVRDDAVGVGAGGGRVLIDPAACARAKLAANRHDRDPAVALRRQSEPFHAHSPTLDTQSNRTRPIVCGNDVFGVPCMGPPQRGNCRTWVMVNGRSRHPRLEPGGRPGRRAPAAPAWPTSRSSPAARTSTWSSCWPSSGRGWTAPSRSSRRSPATWDGGCRRTWVRPAGSWPLQTSASSAAIPPG